MGAARCCGPRDSLLVGLGKRIPNIPIGIVEILFSMSSGTVLFHSTEHTAQRR